MISNTQDNNEDQNENDDEKALLFMQYWGKVSEKFERSLREIKAPCKVIFTLNKLRNHLISLKAPVEKCLRSGIVYKISCSRCYAYYVGQTSRHLIFRFKEHKRSGPIEKHMKECGTELRVDDVSILGCTYRSSAHLMTLEALMIRKLKPALNTKDEFRSRELVIKF